MCLILKCLRDQVLDEHLDDVEVPATSYAVEAGDGRDAISSNSASRHTMKLFCFFWSNMLRFIMVLINDENRLIS